MISIIAKGLLIPFMGTALGVCCSVESFNSLRTGLFTLDTSTPDEAYFVHKHVKPRYDAGCYFMYQII